MLVGGLEIGLQYGVFGPVTSLPFVRPAMRISADLLWFFNSAGFLFEASLVWFVEGGRGVGLLIADLKYDVMRIWRGRIWPKEGAGCRRFCMKVKLEGLGFS